jgi:hypothetical protein
MLVGSPRPPPWTITRAWSKLCTIGATPKFAAVQALAYAALNLTTATPALADGEALIVITSFADSDVLFEEDPLFGAANIGPTY